MDYKAKYKEAFERAKMSYHTGSYDRDTLEMLEIIFPELAESEDERIRKELTEFLKSASEGFLDTTIQCKTFGKWLAWLEKQGEQKPTDKVEPKFKVGDWIVSKTSNLVYCVDSILFPQSKCYCLSYNGGTVLVNFSDEQNYRLWTIQDAKDGDVLATKDAVFIFKYMDKTGLSLCKSYCEVIGNSKLGFGFDFSTNDVYPATKEQRGTLFAKMKEAGYEWDVERKELKKIGQKSAWSEEDNYYRNHIIQIIEEINNAPLKRRENWEAYINWLKSLKQRIQGKKELKVGMRVSFNCFDGSEIIVKITRIENDTVYGISDIGSYHWCNIKDVELL